MLVALSTLWANDVGERWPAASTVADNAGFDHKIVDRAIEHPVAQGHLAIIGRRPDTRGRFGVRVYSLTFHREARGAMGRGATGTKNRSCPEPSTTSPPDGGGRRLPPYHIAARKALDEVARDNTKLHDARRDVRDDLDRHYWPLVERLRSQYPDAPAVG